MRTDDLTKPLIPRKTPAAGGMRAPLVGMALAGLVVAAAGAVILIKGDRLGGEPHVIARIDRQIVTGSTPVTPETKKAAEPSNRETALQTEEVAGVRVVRGNGGQAPGSIIIKVPEQDASGRLAAVDPRLIERSRHGPLPKVDAAAGDSRTLYARPFDAARAGGRPLIAVVVTGLGIGAGATADAIARLPGEVTFAFAPYGQDIEKQAARAREAGHEILLQAPMEAHGGQSAEAAPHTLLAEGSESQNIDRLHWMMARMSGYVGLTNYMGGRFLAVRPALKPVLDDIAARGLVFVEDGAAGRSLVAEVAQTARLPIARADIVLDGVEKPADIEAALQRAEAQARAAGRVILFGPALPVIVERLNRWVRSLDAKGFAPAPVSALVARRQG